MRTSNRSQAINSVECWPEKLARARSKKSKDSVIERKERVRGDYEIRSVANALDLLEAICVEEQSASHNGEGEVRLSQLSQLLGMNKSVVYRMLVTFEQRGYVERIEETGIYRIGVNAYETGRRLLLRMGMLRHARPVMEELSRRCNEAVYLAIRRGNEFLFIDLVESAQQVKIASLVGKRFPLTASAPGQVLLAFSEAPALDLSATVLPETHSKGYHHEQGGLGEMVSCLAAPCFNRGGAVAGALCVVGPAFRMADNQVESIFWPLLKDASEAISSKLGYLTPYTGNVRL